MEQIENLEKTKTLRTLQYREWYQVNRKPKNYHPLFHAGFNFSALTVLVIGHLLFIKTWSRNFIIFFIAVFLFGNFSVWVLHRYPLHRRYRLWSYPFDVHTVEHHRYFTYETITYSKKDDFAAIFFPNSVIALFALVAQPVLFLGFTRLFDADTSHVVCASAAFYFLSYELFHWGSHLPENHKLMKVKWLDYMRKHHRIHHHTRYMHKYNFCIVYPLMDILLGTKFRGELPEEKNQDHYENVRENLKIKEIV